MRENARRTGVDASLAGTIQGSRMLNRQGAKDAKEDAKKVFFLCRVDGKGKGFALQRNL